MDRKRRFSRLGTKLVGVSVLGLALAFVIFYLMNSIVTPWLLYSERFAPFWQRRTTSLIQSYQDYVTEKGLTVQQAMGDREGRLDAEGNGIYAIMAGSMPSVEVSDAEMYKFRFQPSVSESDVNYGLTWTVPEDHPGAVSFGSIEFLTELYQIQCADGAFYVSISPAAQGYESLGRITGLLLALAGFCAVVVPYIVRLLRRLGALSRETGVLMAGDLDHAISVRGRDEVSALGADIERLRRSVLARIEGERTALGANSRLVTSLSHDIRTPLTKLTGYLDILTYGKYQSQEEHDRFLMLAAEKASQLKTLTDQMFASAQAGAGGQEQPPEAVDGGALLGQLLEEQCGDLRREGFAVQPPTFTEDFTLFLRTEDMVRVFDNLFSNFRKYADPAFPVSISLEEDHEKVVLQLENRVKAAPDRTDSCGVGVPTMKELLAHSGGTLEVSLEGEVYRSTLTFRKYRGGGEKGGEHT